MGIVWGTRQETVNEYESVSLKTQIHNTALQLGTKKHFGIIDHKHGMEGEFATVLDFLSLSWNRAAFR